MRRLLLRSSTKNPVSAWGVRVLANEATALVRLKKRGGGSLATSGTSDERGKSSRSSPSWRCLKGPFILTLTKPSLSLEFKTIFVQSRWSACELERPLQGRMHTMAVCKPRAPSATPTPPWADRTAPSGPKEKPSPLAPGFTTLDVNDHLGLWDCGTVGLLRAFE